MKVSFLAVGQYAVEVDMPENSTVKDLLSRVELPKEEFEYCVHPRNSFQGGTFLAEGDMIVIKPVVKS